MARVIAFYVPLNFRPRKPRQKGPSKVIAFDSTSGKDIEEHWLLGGTREDVS